MSSSKGHIIKTLREFGQVSVYKGQDTHDYTKRDKNGITFLSQKAQNWSSQFPEVYRQKGGDSTKW